MKNKFLLLVIVIVTLMLASCRLNRNAEKNEPIDSPTDHPVSATETATPEISRPLQYTIGRNDYVMDVDDTPREFIVHVPAGYDLNQPTPVIVMIHGSNQSGQVMYNNTNWVAKAEAENIIAIFPTSWVYPLIGENGLHEKWNSFNLSLEVVPGTELKDDVKFIRSMMEAIKTTFNVDGKRVFVSGFSNGGGFVTTRLIPQMNDVFAAYSTGGFGLIGDDKINMDVSTPFNTSLYSVFGTNDIKISEARDIPMPFPFTENEIVNDPIFYGMLEMTTTLLDLEPTYTIERDQVFTRFTFADSPTGAGNEYIFMMIRAMGHVYPSGDNNRAGVDVTDLFWEFFLRHPKP